MTVLVIILSIFLVVSISVSAYLIGSSRGKKGEKETVKHIYLQEERNAKRKGFASSDKLEKNILKKKRYTIN